MARPERTLTKTNFSAPVSPDRGLSDNAGGTPCENIPVATFHYRCSLCYKAFSTKSGLGLHRKAAHASAANDDIVPATKRARWNPEESWLLARREVELSQQGEVYLNQALEGTLPGRSFDAIKSHRKTPAYRAMVASLSTAPIQATSVGAAPSTSLGLRPNISPADNDETAVVEAWSSRLRSRPPTTAPKVASSLPATPSDRTQPPLCAVPEREDPEFLPPATLGKRYAVWSKEETKCLAARELSLRRAGSRNINQDLLRLFPGRTIESIRNHRKSKAHRLAIAGAADTLEPAAGEVRGDASLPTGLLTSASATPAYIDDPRSVVSDAIQDTFAPGVDTAPPVVTGSHEERLSEYIRGLLNGEDGVILKNCGLEKIMLKAVAREDVSADLEELISVILPSPAQPRRRRIITRPVDVGRRKKRRSEYAFFQNLYKRDRKKCASVVLDGETPGAGFDVDQFYEAWHPIYNRADVVGGDLPEPDCNETLTRIWMPVSGEEVRSCFPTKNSSPGPDGITLRQLKDLHPVILCALMNVIMLAGRLPPSLNTSRTIFIAKSQSPSGPLDYRPISITSIITRCFHRVIARRLKQDLPWDQRQRAFIDADGSLENTAAIMTILQDAHERGRPLYMASIDIRKAFDSVSHDAAIRAFQRLGCPSEFLDYMRNMQSSATTTFQVNGESTGSIPITCGVRQGDPISPYAFNAVIDELLSKFPDNIGYTLGGERTNSLAFADDMNLLASTRAGLQALLDITDEFLAARNMSVNVDKSHSLSLHPGGKSKKMFVDPVSRFVIGGGTIPAKAVTDNWKYLGILYSTRGRTKAAPTDLEVCLQNLARAPLKPQQRLHFLIFYLIPRLIHGLVLSETTVGTLNKLDKRIRAAVREFLKLPHDTPTSYFYASTGNGGLGVPSLRWSIPRLFIQRMDRLQDAESAFLRAVHASRCSSRRLHKARKWCKWRGTDVSEKPLQQDMWATRLYDSVDGFGLREASSVPYVHRWITDGSSILCGRDFVHAVKLRVNALPTRARTTRGRDEQKTCRAGCPTKETLAHVLQCCPRTHPPRVKRHDGIVKLIAEKCRKRGTTVLVEPSYPTTEGRRKPDLVLSGDGRVVVMDVQVVSDALSLENSHNRKTAYYAGNQSLLESIRREFHTTNMTFTSATFNLRGLIAPSSALSLNDLGLFKRDQKLLSVRCIQGGLAEWGIYNRSTARAPVM